MNYKISDIEKFRKKPLFSERKLYFYFSVRLVYFFQNIRVITPNLLTMISFLLIIPACLMLWLTTELSSGQKLILFFLINLSNIFDAADGQLARLRKQFSRYGVFLDEITDFLKQGLIICSLALYCSGKENYLTVICITAAAIFFIIGKYSIRALIYANLNILLRRNTHKNLRILRKLFKFFDLIRRKLNLGLLTSGEFYLVLSVGILSNFILESIILLSVYALLVNIFEFIKLDCGGRDLVKAHTNNKDLVIFGAGLAGKNLLNILLTEGYKIKFFCDNDTQKIGTSINGIKIISPDDLRGKFYTVIIASEWYYEIMMQLKKMGITDIIII